MFKTAANVRIRKAPIEACFYKLYETSRSLPKSPWTMKHFLPSHSIYFNSASRDAQKSPSCFLFKTAVNFGTRRPHSATQLSLQRLVEETLMKACTMLGEEGDHYSCGERMRWSQTPDEMWAQLPGTPRDVFSFSCLSWSSSSRSGSLGCFETTGELNFSAGPSLWLCRESARKHLATWQASHHVAFEVYPPRCSYHSSVLQENLALTFPWKMQFFSVT